jgi:hypothetical protein
MALCNEGAGQLTHRISIAQGLEINDFLPQRGESVQYHLLTFELALM